MRRSRVDRREKPLEAGQGHDSAEVSARLERCVGLELTEEKTAWRPEKTHAYGGALVSLLSKEKTLSTKRGRDWAEVNAHLN
jgi:hypothetical protein